MNWFNSLLPVDYYGYMAFWEFNFWGFLLKKENLLINLTVWKFVILFGMDLNSAYVDLEIWNCYLPIA